jgi:N-acetyl-gamma-glutamyl-phosphate reductase
MYKSCVIGASGYTGSELARLLEKHSQFELVSVYVSENSADQNKRVSDLHPSLLNYCDLVLQPLADSTLVELADSMDAIFLATPHEASHDWMPILATGKAKIFDLSGAFRLKDTKVFAEYYGFAHQQSSELEAAVYGLADWHPEAISKAQIIAVPGCYPTASLTALKPLQKNGLLDPTVRPVINATSGVSGAGRKAALANSFCEVSLQAYGVLGHRHQPEISSQLGTEVIFTPHLGSFKRGILATVTAKLDADASVETVDSAYLEAYQNNPIIRIQNSWPKLDDVVATPYCDLHWKFDRHSGYIVVSSAIDNLLKGAASQAIQCANLAFGLVSHASLVD